MLAAFTGKDYQEAAERNAGFLLRERRTPYGRSYCVKGRMVKVNSYLEGYAYLIGGLLELYQTTVDPRWL